LADAGSATHACRVEGLPNEVQCGSVQRPLDPARPNGPQIEVHYLVVPAMARNKQPDAVLLLAGGPGQSAIDVAPTLMQRLSRLNNRRDLVFIDQRGTGLSAPLQCADESQLSLQQSIDPVQQLQRMRQCQETLAKLPYGDLRFFTTTLAMQDFEAVRQQLGVTQWNLIGASYGTRAALEYLRQFPQQVRRTVIDGVAPPDMVLPASVAIDGQAALDAVFAACETELQCAQQYPQLRLQWGLLLKRLPQQIVVNDPLTGEPQSVELTRAALLQMLRTPLYAPALAAALPAAIHAAAQGNFSGLVGLSSAMASRKSSRLAMGMHFSVVCAEDAPRITHTTQEAASELGRTDVQWYESVCAFWPRGVVPPAFYQVPAAQSPVLLLSGGADPVTPPRHGERVAKALGAKAQHVVVPAAGHGVTSLACMHDVVLRFITAPTDAQALPQDASCAIKVPRPKVFLPIQAGASKGAGA
jgi:pimeloyl-ACP methyl ester carboxylesterase